MLEPDLTKLIEMDTLDTVTPDQDVIPTKAYMLSMKKGQHAAADSTPLVNIYNHLEKMQSTITMERLQILHRAFKESLHSNPHKHKQYSWPDFAQAIQQLVYCNDSTKASTKVKNSDHSSIPDGYMQALIRGLSTTTERFASSLDFNPALESYSSLHPEDRLFGAVVDAYSCK